MLTFGFLVENEAICLVSDRVDLSLSEVACRRFLPSCGENQLLIKTTPSTIETSQFDDSLRFERH